MRACVVTAAAPGADLSVFAGHELHVVPAAATLTFEHTYTWWGAALSRKSAQPCSPLSTVPLSSALTLTLDGLRRCLALGHAPRCEPVFPEADRHTVSSCKGCVGGCLTST